MIYDNIMAQIPQQEGTFAPCFAFSIHKSGSTMMHAMIRGVCSRMGIPAVSVPDILFSEGVLDSQWAEDSRLQPAFCRNLLYYGFRYLPPMLLAPEIGVRQRKFVLLVRDPRDTLVSEYFSYGKKSGSHRVPPKNAEAFLERAANTADRALDDYVLLSAANLRGKLEAYRSHLDFGLGLLRRYEDVYFNKMLFLGEIFAHLGIDVPAQIIEEVAKTHDIRPLKEDETKHIRKGTPGDHAEKLQPATIARLNDIFRDVGAFYGYAL